MNWTPEEIQARATVLFSGDGWPLVRAILAHSEELQLQQLRQAPLSPAGTAAAVKMAHIEELRAMFAHTAAAISVGEIFDESERPKRQPPADPGYDPADDDYQL